MLGSGVSFTLNWYLNLLLNLFTVFFYQLFLLRICIIVSIWLIFIPRYHFAFLYYLKCWNILSWIFGKSKVNYYYNENEKDKYFYWKFEIREICKIARVSMDVVSDLWYLIIKILSSLNIWLDLIGMDIQWNLPLLLVKFLFEILEELYEFLLNGWITCLFI